MYKRQGVYVYVVAALAALAALAAGACDRGNAQSARRVEVVSVRAVRVMRENVARPISVTGTLGAKEEIALSFKIGGVVRGILVDAGDVVRAGQLLAALDVREIDAAVARASSAAAKAERDLTRARKLYADSVVTLSQMEDAETGAQIARADLEAARFNRRYATIVAPADGVILRRESEPGETLAPGARVLVLGSRERGTVMRIGLADRDLVRVARGDRADVRFDALPGREFVGRVSQVSGSADRSTGTYTVEVSLQNASGLASGLVGAVQIYPAVATRAFVVPIESVLEADGDRASVFALSPDGKHAQRRQVRVAFIDGNRVAIATGLEGVSSVLMDGAAYLNDGAAVRIVQ
jgi:multidrug efflux system membrane fusion protein